MPEPTLRPKEDQNKWNAILSVFFFVVLIVALYMIEGLEGGFPTSIGFFDATLMVLATFRITRLMVYDKITRWVRELFVVHKKHQTKDGVMIELIPHKNGVLHTIYDLFACPWCISVWAALVVVFAYYMFTWGWLMILLLALSGVGSLLQLAANLIGWKAELVKHEVSER